MPFYFRKSVSAGPFRFNFSQRGAGVSIGVKGFRIGTGPRGHYVHAGRNGFYYRATIGKPSAGPRTPAPLRPEPQYQPDASGMIPITSGSVLAMEDSAFADVLQDINAKARQPRLSLILGFVATLSSVALLVNLGPALSLSFLLVPIAAGLGRWLDSYKRAVVLFYDEDAVAPAFQRICEAFDGLASCAGKWHINAAKPVYDLTTWKRQAGASRLVERKVTTLGYQSPAIIRTNVTPPSLHAGNKQLYFLPDVVLIQQRGTFGAVGYDTLSARSQPSNFIEEGAVPRDAEVLYHTWQHPNKGGGPDRRFKYNRQIPVCRYELMHMTSDSGLNELFEFSRFGSVPPFIAATQNVRRQSNLGSELPLLTSSDSQSDVAPVADRARVLPAWANVALWVTGLASVGFIFFGLARLTPPVTPQTAPAVQSPTEVMFVSARRLNCRSNPTASDAVIRTLQRGERVSVLEKQGGWSKIGSDTNACWSLSSALSVRAPQTSKAHRKRHGKRRSSDASASEETPKSSLPEIY